MHIATPETWYPTECVGDDVTHIFEPCIKAFYRCNIWHIRGRDRDLPVRIVPGGHFPNFDGTRYRKLVRDYLDSKT